MLHNLPKPLVYLHGVAPTIRQDLRYALPYNFMGRPAPGYGPTSRCIVSEPLARALAEAQRQAASSGMSLKVYDGYRPVRAVKEFLRWCDNDADDSERAEFYPDLPKGQIVSEGYLSPKSVHCTGSAVDLTLVDAAALHQPNYVRTMPTVRGDGPVDKRTFDNGIDMGTIFDFFGPAAHTMHPHITDAARENRALLKRLLEEHGLINYSKEWWHYALAEPPTMEMFDIPVGQA